MSWYYYKPYVSVAEKKAKAQNKLAKLLKKNPDMKPVAIQGTKIAHTWWGKAWNSNLERYADYSNRIGRGRSYVRNGMVLDLQINPGAVTALIQGTASKPYAINIRIKPIEKYAWDTIKQECLGKIDSLGELLAGKFPQALADIFMAKGKGLFPAPSEISFSCSCPDWASMCKHVAASLYGIGARLDADPMLFFKLRNVDVTELIRQAVRDTTDHLLEKAKKKTSRVMDDADITGVFGIELEDIGADAAQRTADRVRNSDDSKNSAAAALKKTKAAEKNRPAKTKTPKKTADLTSKTSEKSKPVKKPSLKAKQQNTGRSATDIVCELIIKSRKGLSLKMISEKTGFDQVKVYQIVYRLKRQGKIADAGGGVFKKAPASKN